MGSGAQVRPGQTLFLDLHAKDQFGNPTYVIAYVTNTLTNPNLGAFTQPVEGISEGNISVSSLIIHSGLKSACKPVQSQDFVRFDPALVPVQPNLPTNVSYGFTEELVFSELDPEKKQVSLIVETPFTVLGVRGAALRVWLCSDVTVCVC